jgi:hypothetical protein
VNIIAVFAGAVKHCGARRGEKPTAKMKYLLILLLFAAFYVIIGLAHRGKTIKGET